MRWERPPLFGGLEKYGVCGNNHANLMPSFSLYPAIYEQRL